MKKQYFNIYLGIREREIIEAFKESNDEPQIASYDNGKGKDGEKLTGYAIDYDQIDDSFLYDDKEERDADYELLMKRLKAENNF